MWFFNRKPKPQTPAQPKTSEPSNLEQVTRNQRPQKCPYCDFQFEKPVSRKRACPKCKEIIFQRYVEGNTLRLLMTSEQFDQYQEEMTRLERERNLVVISEKFENILMDQGFTIRSIETHLEDYESKTGGNRVLFDYYWSSLNELLATGPGISLDKKSSIYQLMSEIAKYEGRSSLIYDKEWITLNAMSGVSALGIECKYEVMPDKNACPECKRYTGKIFSAKELMKEKPVPVTNCSCDGGCTCWISALPSDYIRDY